MTKFNLSLSILLLFPVFCYTSIAQFGENNLITDIDNLVVPYSISTADIDGDNDLDVLLSSSHLSNGANWSENMFPLEEINTLYIISETFNGSRSIIGGDIDNDGDIDVLSTSGADDKIVWFKNLDGLGTSWQELLVLNFEDGVLDARLYDIDSDGDLDVVYISFFEEKLGWLENLDGLGNFSSANIISITAFGGSQVAGGDIDGDGDIDLLSANGAIDTVAWHENLDGQGAFSPPQNISQNNDGVIQVRLADMDGDSDLDAIACSISDDKIAWYENSNGQGGFTTEHIINTTSNAPRALFTSDLDNDGDIDILSMAQNEEAPLGILYWIENLDGLGNFGSPVIINDELHAIRSVHAADLDNDGDNDVLYSDIALNTSGWHENLTILGVDKQELVNVTIYPNPVTSLLQVTVQKQIKSLEVYTMFNKKLMQIEGDSIAVASLASATYVLKVIFEDGSEGYKKFIKE